MTYKIINTGSDGNAILLNEIMLIDCGVSFKKIKNYYKKLQVILLTHIHGDHFNKKTITKLSNERPNLRFSCCSWLVDELINCGVNKRQIDVLEINKQYNYGLFFVKPIVAYHDVPNCGYKIYWNNKKIIYITDTKTLNNIEAKKYDLYLIEANYSEEEIEKKIQQKLVNNEYIYEMRVKETHLSKEQCDEFILNNCSNNSYFEYLHMHIDGNKEEKNE